MVTPNYNDGSSARDVARLYFMCDCGNRVRCYFREADNGTSQVIEMVHTPYKGMTGGETELTLSMVYTDEAVSSDVSSLMLDTIYRVMVGRECGSKTNIKDDRYGGVDTWLAQ